MTWTYCRQCEGNWQRAWSDNETICPRCRSRNERVKILAENAELRAEVEQLRDRQDEANVCIAYNDKLLEQITQLQTVLKANIARADAAEAQFAAVRGFVRDCRDNWDCDKDAHKYNTPCRSCEARAILAATQGGGDAE